MNGSSRRLAALLPFLALLLPLLLAAPSGAAEIGPPLRVLTAGESAEELMFQGVVGYDARSYDGSGSFGDADANRIEAELRAILPAGDGWEVEGRLGLWRVDSSVSARGLSADVADVYPFLGAGVRTLLWQDNAARGWRVGAALDLSVSLLQFDSGLAVSGDGSTAGVFTVDKPWELRLALPVSRVVVPEPYLLGDWLGIATYTREYYGGPFLRMDRLPVKVSGADGVGGFRESADLRGSSLPGLFGGARWVRRLPEGERSFGVEAQYKDGFNLSFHGALSF